jgi:hypothetical protein
VTAQNSTAPVKTVRGRPFQPGDPRINRGGKPPAILSRAIVAKLTPERADKLAEVLLTKAEAGESWAVQTILERTEGKVPNRNEDGAPGDFDLDLSAADTAKLKASLRVVE